MTRVRRPTIVDVAQAAGVSKSTVSLVLQDSALVRAETRTAVRKAMADLGYVYNRSAAMLRRANAGLVGLVINDLRNPFFTEFATSAQMEFSARGYATVIANTDEDGATQAEVVASMIEHGVSALILSPAYGEEEATFGALARAGIPAMQVLRRVADPEVFPFAAPDYAAGGRLAAAHLFDLGAREVLFVGGVEGRPVTAERMAGYVAVCDERGQPPRAIHGRASRAFGRQAAGAIGAADAAVCFNDLVALGMLAGFAERGVAVGRDFRLVGFDDIEDCAQAFPQLSSVGCDIAGFGQRMAGALIDWLEHGRRPPAETRTPVALIPRASSLGVAP